MSAAMWEATAIGIARVGLPIFTAITVPISACPVAVIKNIIAQLLNCHIVKLLAPPIVWVGLDKRIKTYHYNCVRKLFIQHLLSPFTLMSRRSVLGAGFIFLLSVSLTSVIVILSASSVSANHQEDVLGVASETVLSIPPTSDGPGLVLPDSPLFFLDLAKQQFRLLLAFTPEQKAKIHNAVAGERLAELQLMLSKNNVPGIRIALQGVSDNLKGASEDLTNAKLTGRNISLLAKEINDSIKEKQKALSGLEAQATGEIKAQVVAAREALKIAKVKAEENLPADLLLNETIDDLSQEISDNVSKAKVSATGINRAIEVLTRLASEAAQKNQPARQAALEHAIEVKSVIGEFQKASVNLQKEAPATPAAKSTKK